MKHEDVEINGDFSVKEFIFFLYNHNYNNEISMVKILKRMLSGILFFLLT